MLHLSATGDAGCYIKLSKEDHRNLLCIEAELDALSITNGLGTGIVYIYSVLVPKQFCDTLLFAQSCSRSERSSPQLLKQS